MSKYSVDTTSGPGGLVHTVCVDTGELDPGFEYCHVTGGPVQYTCDGDGPKCAGPKDCAHIRAVRRQLAKVSLFI